MAVLAVAGLLRPEAWVLAGAYWLWCGWRRLDLLALAAAAPLVWASSTCGSPATRCSRCTPRTTSPTSSTATAGCRRSRARSSSFVTDTARPPVALAGRGRRRAAVAAAPRAARCTSRSRCSAPACVTFLATGLAGLSVLPRYLTIPVVAVCLVAGYGVLGFTTLPAGPRPSHCGRGRRSARPRSASSSWRSRRPSSARCAASCASSGARTTTSSPSCTRPRSSATCAAAR